MPLEGLLQPTHLIIILIIAVIVFGPSKLPELGASLGKGIREFKKSTQDLTEVKDSVTSTVTQAVNLEPTRAAAPAPLPSQPEPRHQGPVSLPRQEIE